jgi:hypothetical protein
MIDCEYNFPEEGENYDFDGIETEDALASAANGKEAGSFSQCENV